MAAIVAILDLGFPIGMILVIFDLPVTPVLSNKFLVNWPIYSGEEAKNRFSWWPSWISDPKDFSFNLSTSYSKASYRGSSQVAFQFWKRSEKWVFKTALRWPSWISDGTILAHFYLQVTLMLPTKFGVNWPFVSEEESKNRFSRWQPWWPSWISHQNDFSFF